MKTIKERFLALALILTFALAFLGYMMVRGAILHLDNYVSYFMLTAGIGLILLFGIVLLVFIRYAKKKERIERQEAEIIPFYWKKFSLNLDSVRIKSNQWTDKEYLTTQIYDIETNQKHIQTVLEFELEMDGVKKQFHWYSDREPKSLEMYFAIQKETDFYLDPADDSNYYLDLRFMK